MRMRFKPYARPELLAKQGVYYRLWNGLVSGETL